MSDVIMIMVMLGSHIVTFPLEGLFFEALVERAWLMEIGHFNLKNRRDEEKENKTGTTHVKLLTLIAPGFARPRLRQEWLSFLSNE